MSTWPQAAAAQSGGTVTTTRVITYTYDPLNRLTGATYSTGEQFEYTYDEVGNRTALTETTSLDETTVTTYTYDAANRLTGVQQPASSIQYTWDDRGNLVSDGTFTYAYNGAGRLVRAQSVTSTLVYTYTAQGLRVAQSVDGDASTYAWDWASGLPEMLSEGGNLYLVGHDTLGRWDGATWAYHLPDALGSVRQAADGAGSVASSREWTPFGVEMGTAQAGLGYTGEWWDGDAGLLYLRARWYEPGVGRFTQRDPWPGISVEPLTLNPYVYALANPANFSDPSGYQSESEEFYIRLLYDWYIEGVADRLNVHSLTNLSNNAFATMIAARILVEDATIYADRQPMGVLRELATMPVTVLRPWVRDLLEQAIFGGEISWGPANMRLPFVTEIMI